MEDDVVADARPKPAHLFHELAMMLDEATQLLGLSWLAEPERQGSLMDGSFYEQRALPAFPDFLGEVMCSWGKPYSSRSPIQGLAETFTSLHEAEKHGLVRKLKMQWRLTLPDHIS